MENTIKTVELIQTEEKQVTPCIFDKEQIYNQFIHEQKANGVEFHTAKSLYEMENTEYPFLLDNIIPKCSLSGIIAPSETGKSAILSQLALCIVKGEDFLNLKNNADHKRVLWIATEENSAQISPRIKKQVETKVDAMENLEYVLNAENVVEIIEKSCEVKHYDLIILDCYGDLNTQDTNSVSETRKFMNEYYKLSQKYKVAIMMAHHISKNASNSLLTKYSSMGSTGFVDKCRHVIGLEPPKSLAGNIKLKILKSNLVSLEQKNIVRELKFKDMKFELAQTNNSSTLEIAEEDVTTDKDRIIRRVLELKNEGMSNKAISEKLIEEGFEKGNSESSVRRVINEYELNENEEIVKK